MAISSESLMRQETVYVAGLDMDDAQRRIREGYDTGHDRPGDAYDAIGYFDRNEDDYEVYEFVITTQVRHVKPPYTRSAR